MSDFKLHILGCSSATPTPGHLTSCQVVERRGELYMFDCGEGAQGAFRRFGLKFSRLRHIFISHLHGDHWLGLPGLLSTMALHECNGTVTVHISQAGADLMKRIVDTLCGDTSYNLQWDIIDPSAPRILVDKPDLTIESIKLWHRVECCGFILRERPKPRHLRGDMAAFYGIPPHRRNAIRDGADYELPDGRVIANELLTTPADPAISYAYCSDTMARPALTRALIGVHTIYHESTYDDSLRSKAIQRGHATARQAGETAAGAGASRLILGHYSKRYHDTAPLCDEAAAAFDGEVIAAADGMTIDLNESNRRN